MGEFQNCFWMYGLTRITSSINKNNIKYSEVKVIDMQKINWWKKGTSFLKAKFFGKRYGKSF